MAFAITGYAAYGIDVAEPVQTRALQFFGFKFTAAAANVALDFASYVAGALGTFWTAAGAAGVGAEALACLQDIGPKLNARIWWSLPQLQDLRTQVDASATVATKQYIVTTTSVIPTIAQFAGEGITSGTFSLLAVLTAESRATRRLNSFG